MGAAAGARGAVNAQDGRLGRLRSIMRRSFQTGGDFFRPSLRMNIGHKGHDE